MPVFHKHQIVGLKKIIPIAIISDGFGHISKVLFYVLFVISEDMPLEMRPSGWKAFRLETSTLQAERGSAKT